MYLREALILKNLNKVLNTLETFYHCVNIPVTAINLNGEILGRSGFSPYYEEIFISNRMIEKTTAHMSSIDLKNLDNDLMTIRCPNNISFTIQYNHPLIKKDILYILGPYLNININHNGLAYKPSQCISHLFSLINNISNEIILFSSSNKCCNKKKYHPYINKAIDYININYGEPITIEIIAKYLNINKCYFCSLFKKETGETFSQYLNSLRVEKSKELLLNEKNLSILDVAIAVGFNNQSYFNSIFKKLNNKTPLELRKL